ncbi:MAG: DUF1501 domain-containing protein, partial [Planctomycetia bacterium]
MRHAPGSSCDRGASAAFDRRRFLAFSTGGLATAAVADLARRESSAAEQGHPPPRAKRAIHLCLVGGLSQIDSFDHKPELARRQGEPLPDGVKPDSFFGVVGRLRGSDWTFRQRGASGLWVSDLFPHLARVADELTVIRSLVADTTNHMPAMFQE